MKYKVGDEVLVKVKIIEEYPRSYELMTYDGVVLNAKKDTVLPIPEMTAEEAWDWSEGIEL